MNGRALSIAGLDAYPTPVLADELLDFWAEWYCAGEVNALGVRFLAFLQDPLPVAHGLAELVPHMQPPACNGGRRLNNVERFRIAELIYRERCQASARCG